nr:hypothetical protein [Tanacetum cinerariifolium]
MMVMIGNNSFRLSMNRNQVTIRTMMCQPDNQNVDFSGSDQIQNLQYPDVQENPLTNDEFEACTNANDDKMNNLEIEFDQLQKNTQDFQQKYDDFQNQMRNFMQNFHDGLLIPPPGEEKAPEATTDTKLSSTKDIQPLLVQEPPQDSNMHQLIDECCEEVPEEQKLNMEKTLLELVKICHHKQFLFAPILSTKEPENSLSMRYEHLSITPETESDEITKSNAKNLLQIPSECEVTSEYKKECDELV